MDVDLSIKRTLIMEDVLHIGDVETTSSDISAYKHRSIAICHNSTSELHRSRVDSLNSSLKPVKSLKTLLLLHLAMQALTLDL
jgi:hypothetical protein